MKRGGSIKLSKGERQVKNTPHKFNLSITNDGCHDKVIICMPSLPLLLSTSLYRIWTPRTFNTQSNANEFAQQLKNKILTKF